MNSNICVSAKFGDGQDDERTVYIVSENSVFSEYIYINGKPVLVGRSDILETVKDVLARLEALENN